MTIPNTPPPDELAEVRARIKALEEREAELRKLLIAHPELREGASWLAEVKTVTQDRVDMKELRAMHHELLEEYTFPLEVTRVVLSGITDDGEVISARQARSIAESTAQ